MISDIKIEGDGLTLREEQIIRAVLMTYYAALRAPSSFDTSITGGIPDDQVRLLIAGQVKDFADAMFPGLKITVEVGAR